MSIHYWGRGVKDGNKKRRFYVAGVFSRVVLLSNYFCTIPNVTRRCSAAVASALLMVSEDPAPL